MKKRCETCRYWEAPTQDESDGDPFGSCLRIQRIESMVVKQPPERYENLGLAVIYADLDYPSLSTQAEFGCVLHKPRKAELA